MSFAVDHNDIQEKVTLPEGSYEVIIKEAKRDTTKSGKEYINIQLAVRNDIEQPYKNAIIWHALWKRKEPNDNDKKCDGFSSSQINQISKSVGLEHGKKYSGLSDWLNDLKSKPMWVKVKHDMYDPKKPRPVVDEVGFTKHVICNHVFKASNGTNAAAGSNGLFNKNVPTGGSFADPSGDDMDDCPF